MTTRLTLSHQEPAAQLDPLVSVALIPVPKGMSDGFYAFMGGVGSTRDSTGQLMMLARSFGIPSRMIIGESNYSSARMEADRCGRSR